MVTLDQLRAMVEAGDEAGMDALLLPLAAGLAEYPRVDLDADQAHRFCVGQRQRDLSWPRGLVAVFGPDDAVQGLGQVDDSGLLAPQRRFNL
jgi:tRNA pseudouridine55 synthase